MTGDPDLVRLERGFWLEGAPFFRAHMAEGALMVFPPPVGLLQGEAILQALEGVPRWRSLEMTGCREIRHGDTAALAYEAEARRDEGDPYRALCLSTYVWLDGAWRLMTHQHTPA